MRRRRRRPSLDRPEPIGGVLDRAGDHRHQPGRGPVSPAMWLEVVGAHVAGRSRPGRVFDGKLQVTVTTSAWAQELSHLSGELLDRLRARGVELEGLRFRVGEVPRSDYAPGRRDVPSFEPDTHVAPILEDALTHVEDDELRHALREAIGTHAAWRRALGDGEK